MILTCEKCVFLSLLVHFLEVLLQCVNPCVGQKVTLSTKSDVILFDGERVTLICSVSDKQTDESPEFNITYENGTGIVAGPIHGKTNSVQSVPLDIRRNETFFCSVTWSGFESVTSLSVSPLSDELTHCSSDYTNGIIFGQTLTLTCSSVTSKTTSLTWRSSYNESISGELLTVRRNTFTNTIDIVPPKSRNGTIFTCERNEVQSEQDRCTVGPVYIYDELLVFINPVSPTNPSIILPGESRKYICSSFTGSSIQWNITDRLEASGIELSVDGAMVHVSVSSDSIFTGKIELSCSAILLDMFTVETVTVEIIKRTTTPANTLISSVNETNAPADFALFIAVGAVGGIVAILLIIVITVLICLNCKSNKAATIKPDSKKPTDFTDREYAVPPFGSGQADETQVRVDPSATEEDSELFYSEIDRGGGGMKIPKSDSGALLPRTATIKEAETTASQYKGQDNGGYTSTNGEEAESNFEEEEYSMINRNRVSVVYSAPNKKTSVSSSRSDSQRDNKEDEDSVAIPTYSEVKKGPRRVVIEEDSIDEEYWG